MHPRRIPIAYRYMEGDYSTQFEVMILSWRLWEDDDFPPPGYPMLQEDPYHQPNQQNNQMDADNHSSSSSSNNAPSEPTIDLSAWSPRSYQSNLPWNFGSRPIANKKWVPMPKKLQQNTGRKNATTQLREQPHTPLSKEKTIFFDTDLITPQQLNPQKRQRLAIEDHTCSHNPQWISPSAQTYILSAQTPIHITPPLLSYLVKQLHNRTMRLSQLLRAARSNPTLLLHNSLVQYKHHDGDNTRKDIIIAEAYKSPRQVILQALQSYRPIISPIPLPLYSLTHNSPLLTTGRADILNAALNTSPLPIIAHQSDHQPSLSPDTAFNSPRTSNNDIPQHFPTPLETYQTGLNMDCNDANPDLSATPISSVPILTRKTIGAPPHIKKKTQKKEKQMATRRSPRIQARHLKSPINTDSLPVAKSNATKIPFNVDDSINSLDVSLTVSLLQATGLQITDQIKQLIEQAANQDETNEQEEQFMPSTPLHDPIPPLAIPGTDIVL